MKDSVFRLLELVLKGGFGILFVRIIVSNINEVFTKRSREIQVRKMLKHEIDKNLKSIESFLNSLDGVIVRNKTITNNSYMCVSNASATSDLVFRNNYNEIFKAFEKYSKGSMVDLTEVYTIISNYEILLNSYRELYLGFNAITHRTDPNIKFKNIALDFGLSSYGVSLNNVNNALALINDGKWYWKVFKNYQVHKFFAVLFGLLFINIPSREELA